MTCYTVQYVLPVDNPVNKVRVTRGKDAMIFEVPINYPDAHNLTFRDLLQAAEDSGLLGLSTHLKKKKVIDIQSANMPSSRS